MLLRVALQAARDDYEDRREHQRQGIALAKEEGRFTGRPDSKMHASIVALRSLGESIANTANLVGWHGHRKKSMGNSQSSDSQKTVSG